jgi:hypothetical protein
VTEEWPNVQIEVLAILPHARALEAVGFGLRDPRRARFEDGRTEMRGCVHALLDLDDRVRQPCTGFLFSREVFVHRRLLPLGPGAK